MSLSNTYEEQAIATARLIISGPEETRDVQLDTKGATLGRGSDCDIVLEHRNISRNHARIYQDPFGRWIIEDLDSQNGILIDGKPIKNRIKNYKEAPANTALSDTISKDLKKRGFKFVGTTVIYAHMQATGMVNDHEVSCFRYNEV